MQSISKRPFVQFSSFRLISAAAICSTLFVAPIARAQDVIAPPPTEAPPLATLAAPQVLHFGQAGQWFLSAETFWTPFAGLVADNGPSDLAPGGNTGDVSVSWSSASNSSTNFQLNLQPVAGYFFTEVIFGRLGFDIGFAHTSGQDVVGVGVAPGVGIALPLANKLAFAPWIGLNFMYVHAGTSDTVTASLDNVKLNLEVHAPVVLDIADHFALTAGIYYAQGLVNHISSGGASGDGAKLGTVGLTAGLLGYW